MKSVKLYHSLNFCFDSEIIGSYGMSEEKLRSEVKKKIQNLLTNPEMCFSDHALNGFGLTAVVEPSRAFALDIDSFMENGVRKIPEYLCDEDGTCPYEVNLSSPDFDFYSWAKNDAPNLRGRRNDRPNYYTEVFAKVSDPVRLNVSASQAIASASEVLVVVVRHDLTLSSPQ